MFVCAGVGTKVPFDGTRGSAAGIGAKALLGGARDAVAGVGTKVLLDGTRLVVAGVGVNALLDGTRLTVAGVGMKALLDGTREICGVGENGAPDNEERLLFMCSVMPLVDDTCPVGVKYPDDEPCESRDAWPEYVDRRIGIGMGIGSVLPSGMIPGAGVGAALWVRCIER